MFADQDALNIIFNHNLIYLPFTWNMMIDKCAPPEIPLQNPKIAHFAFKPWKSSSSTSFWITNNKPYYYPDIETWWKIAFQTPFFQKDIKIYCQSNSYKKIVKRQEKLENLFINSPSLKFYIYLLNKQFAYKFKKIERFFKQFREKYRDWKVKKANK